MMIRGESIFAFAALGLFFWPLLVACHPALPLAAHSTLRENPGGIGIGVHEAEAVREADFSRDLPNIAIAPDTITTISDRHGFDGLNDSINIVPTRFMFAYNVMLTCIGGECGPVDAPTILTGTATYLVDTNLRQTFLNDIDAASADGHFHLSGMVAAQYGISGISADTVNLQADLTHSGTGQNLWEFGPKVQFSLGDDFNPRADTPTPTGISLDAVSNTDADVTITGTATPVVPAGN